MIKAVLQYNGMEETLRLPCEEEKITFAYQKLQVPQEEEPSITLKEPKFGNTDWDEKLAEIINEEGLFVANQLTHVLSLYQKDLRKLATVVEYAESCYDIDVTATNIMKLAHNLDKFNCMEDVGSYEYVGRRFIDENPKYQLSEDIEDYFDFEKFGEIEGDNHDGHWVGCHYVSMEEGCCFYDIFPSESKKIMIGGMVQ